MRQKVIVTYAILNIAPLRTSENKYTDAMFGLTNNFEKEGNRVPDIDIVSKFREALACYSEADFEAIFTLGGIEGQELQDLGKDFLGIAGAFYLSAMERQARQGQKTETLKYLAKAQRASRDLADNLGKALQDRSMIGALMEASLAARTAYPDDDAKRRDSFKILNSIFPLSADGSGFRYEGLSHAMTILAECIALVEADAIEKPMRGRKHALRPWAMLMFLYWTHAKGDLPRGGHYDRETAEYGSPAMASLGFAAERLDPELTDRTLASLFGTVSDAFIDNLEEPLLLSSIGFSQIIAENASVSGGEALGRYLEMPPGYAEKMASMMLPSANPAAEKAIVSKEEFFETIDSTEAGKTLLQGLMAVRELCPKVGDGVIRRRFEVA
jgi:hypothetical protein